MPLHVSSTYAHHQEVKIALHSLWHHHTCRWPSGAQVERGLSKFFFLVCYIYLINLKFWSGKEILCETPCWPVDIQHAELPVYYFQVCWECKVVGARLVHVKVAPLSVPLMPARAWTFRPMLKDLTVLDTESAQSPCPCWESNPCFSATLVTVCLQSAMWRPF
jgi:hypothetical protein